MDKKTLHAILAGEIESIVVRGYRYDIYLYDEYTLLEPHHHQGNDMVDSRVPLDSYKYTHGGDAYQKALEIAKEIQDAKEESRE